MLGLNRKIEILSASGEYKETVTLGELHEMIVGSKLNRYDYSGDYSVVMGQIWRRETEGNIFIDANMPKKRKLALARKLRAGMEDAA